jgi:hypothetical protein
MTLHVHMSEKQEGSELYMHAYVYACSAPVHVCAYNMSVHGVHACVLTESVLCGTHAMSFYFCLCVRFMCMYFCTYVQ